VADHEFALCVASHRRHDLLFAQSANAAHAAQQVVLNAILYIGNGPESGTHQHIANLNGEIERIQLRWEAPIGAIMA
jgi:hypothetical protein